MLRGLPIELPEVVLLLLLLKLRGDSLGLVGLASFLAAALACRRAIVRVPRTSLGEVTGELVARAALLLLDAPAAAAACDGLGGTAGGIVARFIGGEYRFLRLPLMPLAAGGGGGEVASSSSASRDSQGLQMRGRGTFEPAAADGGG